MRTYCISGAFDRDFNLAVYQVFLKSPNLSHRQYYFKKTLWEYLVVIPGQSIKLNVHVLPNFSAECTTLTVSTCMHLRICT